jgi:cytochrome c5
MRNVTLTLALAVCSVASSASRADERTLQLKEGAGRDVTMARCTVCHSVDYITMVAPVMNRAAWEKSVRKMIDVFGAPMDEQDASRIVEYLGRYYAAVEARD